MRSVRLHLLAVGLLLASGCGFLASSKNTDDDDDNDNGSTEVADSGDTASVTDPGVPCKEGTGYCIAGNVEDVLTASSPPAGTCVEYWDMSPLLAGRAPTVVASTTTSSSGAYALSNITEAPEVGHAVAVGCGGDATLSSVTFFGTDAFETEDGAENTGVVVISTSDSTLDQLQSGLAAAGFGGSLSDGMLVGAVLDTSGDPIDGATVSCAGTCRGTYYRTGSGWNTEGTDSSGQGQFVIPGASANTYEFDLPGGGSGHALMVPPPEATAYMEHRF